MSLFVALILVGFALWGRPAAEVGRVAAAPVLTNQTISQAIARPAAGAGNWRVSVDGRVVGDPQYDGEGTHVQLFLATGRQGVDIIVDYPLTLELTDGDFIHVRGKVAGAFSATTESGARLKTIRVAAKKITPSSGEAALAPALATRPGPGRRETNDVTIVLERLEFAAIQTRAYVRAINRTPGGIVVHLFNSQISQRGREFLFQQYPQGRYVELPVDVGAGAEVSGVLVYPPLSPKAPLRLTIGVSGAGWEADFKFDSKPRPKE